MALIGAVMPVWAAGAWQSVLVKDVRLPDLDDTHVVSALKEKRIQVAGQIES